MRMSARGIFSLFLIALVATMIVAACGYSPKARVFPLLFGIGTLLLLVFQVLGDWWPSIEKRLTFVQKEGVFSSLIEKEVQKTTPGRKEDGDGGLWLKVTRLFLWLIGLTVALRFLNYVIVVPIFIFLIIAVEAGTGWFRAFILAVATGLFIYLLFGVVLRVSL